jgi:hypothetical protein
VLVALGVVAQLAIVAHAPDTVTACDAVTVSVAVRGNGTEIPRLVSPAGFGPFSVLRSTPTPHVEFTARSVLAEYQFTLTTDQQGQFTIPAFEARTSTARATTRPMPITVRPLRGRGVPAVVTRARIDTTTDLSLRAAAAETVYVGQQATYEVAVFLNQVVRERLRRNPTFYPPEMQAMLAYDLPAPTPATRRRIASQCFDALVYRRALFPLVAGRLVIPPAQLVYATGISSTSLFSREESHELQTDSVTIIAVDPPAVGRPDEYSGAVGSVHLEARLDTIASRVGDPMLYTVRVLGVGNVRLFPRPVVRVPWAALVAADERVRVDSTNPQIGGAKEFDWVLTPRIAGELDLPPVRYGYFDPARRRYDVAVAPGQRLMVGTGALAASDTGNIESVLDIRPRYRGPAWPPLQSRAAFWVVMALVPVPAIVSRAKRRASARVKRPVVDDPMRALLGARVPDNPIQLRRQFVRALAQRLGCNPEDFTHPGALERSLRRAGVSVEIAGRAEALLRSLDSAAYAHTGITPPNASREATAVAKAVDQEALARSELPFWIPALWLAASLVVASDAMAAGAAPGEFARGVSAYMRADYVSAREAFASAVATAPASADAWANYGTASWTLNDTAGAALGWRQALAIEPAANDLRQRMLLIREEGPTSPGWVPAVPRNAAVWLFAVLWVSAWTLAWVARRPGSWAARWPMPLAVCAVIVGLLAIEIETRVAGDRLAVVRRSMPLTSDPAMGMDRGPMVGTGELVRIAGRRGPWTRVEASADRDGWISASHLLLLDDRRIPRD